MYSFTQKVNNTSLLFARRKNAQEQFEALTANIKRIKMRINKRKAGDPQRVKLEALLKDKIDSACILANAIAQPTLSLKG